MRYLNRVFFINSANVKYAEIAIDGNVHFIGTQGVGKSTLLRAILFFYNADKTKLGIEKGKKTFDEYYFPFANSYLVYEVVKETGAYCVMAFKSQGRACFRFINGAYGQEHFVSEEGKVRTWEGIRESFGKKTSYASRKIDNYGEYKDILYGNNLGLEKEFRKYALVESRQYQNIPRTIQNVFLNSKLDAEFIKQTIIMSLNEEDVKIKLDTYALHLHDFETQLKDINKWTEANKAGEVPVRKMAENIARLHAAIQALDREKKETAIQLFSAYGAAITELPLVEKNLAQQQQQLKVQQEKCNELGGKYQAKKEELQKQVSILDENIKRAKKQADYYETINISSIIEIVSRKEEKEAEKTRLHEEQTLLKAKFTEINTRYEAMIQQQQQAYEAFKNVQDARKNKSKEEFLVFTNTISGQHNLALAGIRNQHHAELALARNSISQKKDIIHGLGLKKQRGQLQRYFEEETEAAKGEINVLQQKIKNNEIDIEGHKKQAEALQKQWELDLDKNNAGYDRKIEKMREEGSRYIAQAAAIEAKLKKNKGSLYGWLNTNVPGWENNIGKVIDEELVLFHAGLSPSFDADAGDTFFGLKIDLGEVQKVVKTVAGYEAERLDWQQKADTNRAAINTLIEQRNDDADKLKSRYQSKIKEVNNARRQMEYELQRAKGQLLAAEVKYADLVRKGAGEKELFLQQVKIEIEAASESLVAEEKNLEGIEAAMQKQLDNKEKEYKRKEKAEAQRITEIANGLEQELQDKWLETDTRIAAIKERQNSSLASEGADVARLGGIDKELAAIIKVLEYINNNRDKVAEYNKDKRELLDNADAYKAEKRAREHQLENEQEKHNLQRQKIQQEIDALNTIIAGLDNKLTALNEGVSQFISFKLTGQYIQVAEYEGQQTAISAGSAQGLKQLIDTITSKIYTLQDRYNDLQSAINKFTAHFEANNIFGFKSNFTEKNEFTDFAEMLYEFIEEDKIVQYEKRVNERFANLISQIGKETTSLTSKGGEIQKVITEINRDFEERNFAGVIKSIRLQLSESKNAIVKLLQEIKKFNDQNSMGLGAVNLFSGGDNEGQNRKAIALLKDFAREINAWKEKEISLPDSFELHFRIVENENDSGWVEKLTNVGSEGTDILVKAMINIMLLNVFKDSASKRFKEFRLHCMMDEIGKLHPNNVKGILKFANDRNILLINSSPTSYNAIDYRYTYLLSKDSQHVTTVKRLVKKGVEV